MAESAGHAGTYRAEPSTVASDLGHHHVMAAIIFGLFGALGSALRARGDLVLENLALRQQLAIFKHRDPRLRLTHPERLFWIALSRVWSRWREALLVVKPGNRRGLAPLGFPPVLDLAFSAPSAWSPSHEPRGA